MKDAPTTVPARNNVAFRLYLLFIISWFTHLGSRVPVLGLIRLDLLLVLLVFGLIVADEGSAKSKPAPRQGGASHTGTLILAILVYAIVTAPFVEWPGTALRIGVPGFIKAVVFYLFTARLVTTSARLKMLMLVFVASMTFRVLEPLYLHVTVGYWGSEAYMSAGAERMDRLSGAPYDVINPNGLAFVILTVIPFFHYLSTGRAIVTVLYLSTLPLLLWALVLTGSRSGLLGLAAVFLTVVSKSRHKILLLALAGIVLIAAIPALPADLADRYLSIVDSNTKNGATADGRLDGFASDLKVALRRPLFGHGLGTSLEANTHFAGAYMPSHNLYTETAQELGFCGLALLIWLIWSTSADFRISLQALRRTAGVSPFLISVTDAAQTWLWMNLLFSFASFGLKSYEWYFAAGLASVLRHLASQETAAPTTLESVQRLERAAHVATVPSEWRKRHSLPVS